MSPLGRARHTAEYLIQLKNLDYEIIEFFRELNGRYNDNQWAWNYHGCDLLKPGHDITKTNWQALVPYGKHMEPVYKTFTSQFDAFIAGFGLERSGYLYKINQPTDQTIAVVCHAGVITTLLSHLLHIPLPVVYSQFCIDPSSVTRIKLEIKDDMGVFRLITLNDMSHTASMS